MVNATAMAAAFLNFIPFSSPVWLSGLKLLNALQPKLRVFTVKQFGSQPDVLAADYISVTHIRGPSVPIDTLGER